MDSIGFRGGVATVKRVRKCKDFAELHALDPWYELLAQMAGNYWTNEEMKALLRIWGAANVQAQLFLAKS